jgi:hypothetical protein
LPKLLTVSCGMLRFISDSAASSFLRFWLARYSAIY